MTLRRHPSRRAFLARASAVAGAAAFLGACRESTEPAEDRPYARLTSRPTGTSQPIESGIHELGLDPQGRDGFFYVPKSYAASTPAPLLVLLHGGGQSDTAWRSDTVTTLMDQLGAVLLAPESGGDTWDFPLTNLYGPDVTFIDQALAVVFRRCNIRRDAITLGGFSDGASEALGLGVINGDLFSAVMAFSPGSFQVPWFRGDPRVFVSHGTSDDVLLPSWTRDFIVPELKRMGFSVEFVEYDGGHVLPVGVFEPAVRAYVA